MIQQTWTLKKKRQDTKKHNIDDIKNRNGRTGKRINYLYDPRFNHFDEDEYYTKQTKKKLKS